MNVHILLDISECQLVPHLLIIFKLELQVLRVCSCWPRTAYCGTFQCVMSASSLLTDPNMQRQQQTS